MAECKLIVQVTKSWSILTIELIFLYIYMFVIHRERVNTYLYQFQVLRHQRLLRQNHLLQQRALQQPQLSQGLQYRKRVL